MGWDIKETVLLMGVIGVSLAGWNAYLQSKLGTLTRIWRWRDEFIKQYAADRLSDAKEYATRMELARALEKLEHSIEELDIKLDKLLMRGP